MRLSSDLRSRGAPCAFGGTGGAGNELARRPSHRQSFDQGERSTRHLTLETDVICWGPGGTVPGKPTDVDPFPAMARHGCDRGQLDLSAGLLRVFERLGWATEVRWPEAERLGRRRALAKIPFTERQARPVGRRSETGHRSKVAPARFDHADRASRLAVLVWPVHAMRGTKGQPW